MLENGVATPQELVDAILKCSEEKPCEEERTLIEQSYPLLLAGLAGVSLAIPMFRVLRTIRAAFFSLTGALSAFLSRIPWVGRFFGEANFSAPAAGAAFETAAAGLTPEYLAAVASSQSILSRIQAAVKVEGVTAALLFLAGYIGSAFDVEPTGDDNGEQA